MLIPFSVKYKALYQYKIGPAEHQASYSSVDKEGLFWVYSSLNVERGRGVGRLGGLNSSLFRRTYIGNKRRRMAA